MDIYVPTSMLLVLEAFRQYVPAQHLAYFRGDIWALARLGTTRTCMTNVARTRAFAERHLASWERYCRLTRRPPAEALTSGSSQFLRKHRT